MVAFFDAQNIMQVMSVEDFDMRSVGAQAVFGDDHLEMGVVLTQFDDQPFGRIAFAVVFMRNKMFDKIVRPKGKKIALLRIYEGGAHHLVAIGDSAISVMRF